MPTFDVVSEVDFQEVRNAVDQAHREITTRFDFKGTNSSIELKEKTIELHTESDQRLKALTQVLEEKLVKRKVSLKALSYGKVEEASKGTVRQVVTLMVGINQDKAREIGKFVKELGLKGVSHQVQGDQLRISGKKRDDLQTTIGKLKEHDFGIPLDFTNFRD
jgi:cyclic-di-GMP-binding protein